MFIVFSKMKYCIFYLRGKINFKLFDMYVKNKLIYGAKHREFVFKRAKVKKQPC